MGNRKWAIRRLGTRRMTRPARPQVEPLDERRLLSITISGNSPITSLTVGTDGAWQVHFTGFANGQVFNSNATTGDAGLLIRKADGVVDGFDVSNASSAAQATNSHAFHPISQVESPDGHSITTVMDNSTDGDAGGGTLQVTQVTTLNPGDPFFRTDNTILNQGTAPVTIDVFAAADIFLADSDKGVGYLNTGVGAVGGTDRTGTYHIFVQPDTGTGLASTNYQEAYFNTIWQTIGTPGANFNNTDLLPTTSPPYDINNDPNYIDNGAGLEWHAVTIPAGGTATISYYWSFGSNTSVPADAPLSAAGVTLTTTAPSGSSALIGGTVATFTDADPNGNVSQFSATIDWGDGSPASHGQKITALPGGGFAVVDVHTYTGLTASRSFPVTVTINDVGGAAAVAHSTAAITVPPPAGQTLSATGATVSATGTPGTPTTVSGTVATFTDADNTGDAAQYTATIDWGDGTNPTSGTIVPLPEGTGFAVGGSHTYGPLNSARSFPLTVTIHDADGTQTTAASAAMVTIAQAGVPFVTGSLNPLSDTGVSQTDHITNDNRPEFDGTATPGAVVELIALPTNGTFPTVMGQTIASPTGVWSIVSVPLVDGIYAINATATNTATGQTATTQLLPGTSLEPLVIDTVGPKVAALSFKPQTGQIFITFTDSVPLAGSMLDPANYSFLRKHPRAVEVFGILGVTAIGTPTSGGFDGSETVEVTVGAHGRARIGHGRRYLFTILSGGVTDIAGNALQGSFNGTFPSGNGHPANFVANLLTTGRITFPPRVPTRKLLS